jgi:hypothetical protein
MAINRTLPEMAKKNHRDLAYIIRLFIESKEDLSLVEGSKALLKTPLPPDAKKGKK